MKHGDKITDTRADLAAFLTKITHRMRDDLAQLEQYEKVAILPDLVCLEILERILLNLTFYLRKRFPKQKKKEAITLPETTGKTLCSHVDGYLSLLDDIRSYMRKRGVWTENARLITAEVRSKSLELSQLIPLD